jgi:Ca2+-binding RTX toxin-like protein
MAASYSIPKAVVNPYVYTEGTDNGETIFGTNYNDEIHGRGGNDFIFGGLGDDLIFGDDGNDTLVGEAGNDTLNGGIGDDTLVGGAGADKFFGGAGFDTVSYASSSLGVYVDMATVSGTNDAYGDTFNSVEKIVGSNYDDVISGDVGDNTFEGGNGTDWLSGWAGSDKLYGNIGDDHLNGGTGDDTLVGGSGRDTLIGGSGRDVFVVSAVDGADKIMDFEQGIDHIKLTDNKIKQPFGADGELMYMFGEVGAVVIGAGPNETQDSFIWDDRVDTLFQVSWAWDSSHERWTITAANDILHIENGVQLTASDFFL